MGDAAIRVIQAFRHADVDGNGVITKEELLEVLGELAPGKWDESKVEKLMAAIDTNGDGLVQYEEFIAFLFDKSSSDWSKAKKHLGQGANRRESMKVVKPAEVLEDEEEESMKVVKVATGRKGDGFGRILVFFDVDGVLNSTGSFESSDEDDEAEDAKADNTVVSDPQGRWAARISRICLDIFRKLLRSFDEKEDAGLHTAFLQRLEGKKEGEQLEPKVVDDSSAPKKNRVRLVLTSTWRFSEDQTSFIRSVLEEAGISEEVFLGGTAVMAGASRSEEIMHYIGEMHASGKDVAAWVAIDSCSENLAVLPEANQVRTWEVDGLNEDSAMEARELLIAQDTAWLSQRKLPPPGYPQEFEFKRKKKKEDKGGKTKGDEGGHGEKAVAKKESLRRGSVVQGDEGGDGEKAVAKKKSLRRGSVVQGDEGEKVVGKKKSLRRGSVDQGDEGEKAVRKTKSSQRGSHDQGDDEELLAAPRRERRASTVPAMSLTVQRSERPAEGPRISRPPSAGVARQSSPSPSAPGSARGGPPSSSGAEGGQRKASKKSRRASLDVACMFPQESVAKPVGKPRPASATVRRKNLAVPGDPPDSPSPSPEEPSPKQKAGRRKSTMAVPESSAGSPSEEPSPRQKGGRRKSSAAPPESPPDSPSEEPSPDPKASGSKSLESPERPEPGAAEQAIPKEKARRRNSLDVPPIALDEPSPEKKATGRRKTLHVVEPAASDAEAQASVPRSADEPAPKSKAHRRRSMAASPSASPRPDGAGSSSGIGDKAGTSASDAPGEARPRKGSKSPSPRPSNAPTRTPSKSPSPRPSEP